MSKDKQERHDQNHHERAAEPDAPGHKSDAGDGAAHSASQHQKHELVEGDGGRYSGPVGVDVEARILAVKIEGGNTHILLGGGRTQGIEMDMPGYIKGGAGMIADFYVESVTARTAWAVTDVTVDTISQYNQVVVNPSAMPKSAMPLPDMKARILDISIAEGKTRIMIGRGRRSGASVGMKGYLVGDGGKPFANFVIAEEHSTHTVAYVEHTLDEVRAHTDVILNPSTEHAVDPKQHGHAPVHDGGQAGAQAPGGH